MYAIKLFNECMHAWYNNKFTEFKFTVVNILQKNNAIYLYTVIGEKNNQNHKWHIKKNKGDKTQSASSFNSEQAK